MPDSEKIDEAFRHARAQLRQIESVRSQVDDRISTRRPAARPVVRIAACSVSLLILGALLWTFLSPVPPAVLPETVSIQTDNAELTEHLSAVLDHETVIVIWSYRGSGLITDYTERQAGRYRLHTLGRRSTPDGRTLVFTLFRPDAGVKPVFDPPSISATLPDHTSLALRGSPRRTSQAEFAAALHLAAGRDSETILREINDQPLQ